MKRALELSATDGRSVMDEVSSLAERSDEELALRYIAIVTRLKNAFFDCFVLLAHGIKISNLNLSICNITTRFKDLFNFQMTTG